MLGSLIAYTRGAGVDARWVVIEGDPEFFRVTKRIHNRLLGATGDGGARTYQMSDHLPLWAEFRIHFSDEYLTEIAAPRAVISGRPRVSRCG
jgi:hypothetical protein